MPQFPGNADQEYLYNSMVEEEMLYQQAAAAGISIAESHNGYGNDSDTDEEDGRPPY